MFDEKALEATKTKESINLEDLNKALISFRRAEEEYDEVHAVSTEKYKIMDKLKQEFIELLEAGGIDRWEVEGEKGFTKFKVKKFRVPQTVGDKAHFWKFMKTEKVSEYLKQEPQDIFLSYATVHHAALNSLCNLLHEKAAESGEILDIPGIQPPTYETRLRSLKRKK